MWGQRQRAVRESLLRAECRCLCVANDKALRSAPSSPGIAEGELAPPPPSTQRAGPCAVSYESRHHAGDPELQRGPPCGPPRKQPPRGACGGPPRGCPPAAAARLHASSNSRCVRAQCVATMQVGEALQPHHACAWGARQAPSGRLARHIAPPRRCADGPGRAADARRPPPALHPRPRPLPQPPRRPRQPASRSPATAARRRRMRWWRLAAIS